MRDVYILHSNKNAMVNVEVMAQNTVTICT